MTTSVLEMFAKNEIYVERLSSLVVGVSGGVDSIVLLQVLVDLGISIHAVHVNYQLRGAESNADEDSVRRFCARLDVPLTVDEVNPEEQARLWKTSVQDAARRQRYEIFENIAERVGSQFVAVAHNRDDQAETLLMHLARGTGIDGLAGMPFRRPSSSGSSVEIIRPMLSVPRSDIREYAEERGLDWCEDSTNLHPKYTRARVRSDLRPVFEASLGAESWSGIAATAALMREYVEQNSMDLAGHLLAGTGTERRFSIDVLRKASAPTRNRILLECIRQWIPDLHGSRATVQELVDLLDCQPGSVKSYGSLNVVRDRHWIWFVRREAPDEYETELPLGSATKISAGTLRFDELHAEPLGLDPLTRDAVFVDLDDVGRLFVRPWRNGDRIRLLGSKGTKKVSDVLTDCRVPTIRRASCAVVLAENGEVIWIVGMRSAEKGKVAESTNRFGLLSFYPSKA